eukprot:6371688-Prymnesium_polylepis.1
MNGGGERRFCGDRVREYRDGGLRDRRLHNAATALHAPPTARARNSFALHRTCVVSCPRSPCRPAPPPAAARPPETERAGGQDV